MSFSVAMHLFSLAYCVNKYIHEFCEQSAGKISQAYFKGLFNHDVNK